MKNNFFVLILSILLLPLVFFPSAAAALTLTPPLLEFGVDPGGEIISKIKVFNESSETISLYTSTANFTTKDETGTPFFLFEEQEGLASWIEMSSNSIVLLPGERQDVPFSIKVPKDADAGGYYAGIFFGSSPKDGSTENDQVKIVSKLGMLILLRVSGNITNESAIQEFRILDDQKFFTKLPVQFFYRLRNKGNVHIRPAGVVEIKGILGFPNNKIEANPVDGAVLPDSIRQFKPIWQKSEPAKIEHKNFFLDFFAEALAEYRNFALGPYTAALNLSNVSESLLLKKITFWVFPWHFLLILTIILIIVVLAGSFTIRKYNKHIISKAMSQNQIRSTKSEIRNKF